MTIKNNVVLLLAGLIFLGGCSGKAVKPDQNPEAPQGTAGQPGEVVGPPLPPDLPKSGTTEPSGPVGPQPTPDFKPPKEGVVLVLGPGLARTLAYVGVLREFEASGTPIYGVVGVEMGAVIAGLWATSNINNLEWEMHKFKRETLLDFPMLGLVGRKDAEGKRLRTFLESALKSRLLQKTKVPLVVISQVRDSSDLIAESNGDAVEILRGAMGIPGLIKPYEWEGKERMSAGPQSPFPVDQAKGLGVGTVVCVDVIGRADTFKSRDSLDEQISTLMRSTRAVARQQLSSCDTLINVPVEGTGYLNFDSRADLVYQGKIAARKWLEQHK